MCALCVVAGTAALASSAQAATYTVGTTTDSPGTCATPSSGTCSLRQLITYENGLASAPNPVDTIMVPAGFYSLSNEALVISQSVNISGAGAHSVTVDQSSSNPDRVFDVQRRQNGTQPTVTISGMMLEFGTANSNNNFFGGDVRNSGILTLSEDWITAGNASSGGGIGNVGGVLTVTHSLVSGNTAGSGGSDSGGIQNYGDPTVGPSKLTVDNSTISNNTSQLGGGIFSWCAGTNGACSSSTATNSTTITNSTIAFNNGGSRGTNGGGLLVGSGTMTVQNSIVAGNAVNNPSSGTASNCGGPGITSLGHNLESGTDCGFKSAGDLQSRDPKFTSTSALDNGGNTSTLALDAASPAVDAVPAGSPGCNGTDQRDIGRPQGTGCDMGAVEVFQPVEGQSAQIQVHADSCGIIGTATINWGDGTSSQSTRGTFIGAHTYAEEGLHNGTLTYSNDCNGTHSAVPFDVKVQDAPLSPGNSPATSPKATAGVPFTGQVGQFTDPNPGPPSSYSAAINWGDGQSSAGTVSSAGSGFAVSGTHTYAATGTYPTTVQVTDPGGATTTIRGSIIVDSAPGATTSKPAVQSSQAAAFSGVVDPQGLPTSAHFVYGLDQAYRPPGFSGSVYDQSTPDQSIGSDFSNHNVAATVAGLIPNAVYHVRLVAANGAGTTSGPDQTFSTPKAAPPGAPLLGKTENLTPVSGRVFVSRNGQLVPLTQATQLPTGTQIDALDGSLNLAGSTGKKGQTYTGTFGGALFQIAQARAGLNKGLTTLSLIEGRFGVPSYSSCKAKHAADRSPLAHAALSRRVLQTLRSSARGRFSTRGRYAAATVRGTRWTTTDRCDGTLVSVQLHSVFVTDLIKHLTVLITVHHSYLAKPKHP